LSRKPIPGCLSGAIALYPFSLANRGISGLFLISSRKSFANLYFSRL
jgi:hypothetical protein